MNHRNQNRGWVGALAALFALLVVVAPAAAQSGDNRAATQGDINRLQGGIDGLQGDINLLQGDINRLEVDIKRLDGDIKRLDGRIERLSDKVDKTATQDDFKRLSDKVDENFKWTIAAILAVLGLPQMVGLLREWRNGRRTAS